MNLTKPLYNLLKVVFSPYSTVSKTPRLTQFWSKFSCLHSGQPFISSSTSVGKDIGTKWDSVDIHLLGVHIIDEGKRDGLFVTRAFTVPAYGS